MQRAKVRQALYDTAHRSVYLSASDMGLRDIAQYSRLELRSV